MAAAWPAGSDGRNLNPGATVRIENVPDDSVKSMLNGQQGVCTKYDKTCNRVFVRIDTGETLAFPPANLVIAQAPPAPPPRNMVSVAEADRPRGSGGCVLCPGTVVRIHGVGKKHADLNGQEAICEFWDGDLKLMFVKLRGSGVSKAISNKKLRKVRLVDMSALDPEEQKVLAIFQANDTDGDGLIDYDEFAKMLRNMGMGEKILAEFLQQVDKNGDAQIMFEEFLDWILSPCRANKSRFELFWPKESAVAYTAAVHVKDDEGGDGEDDDELTLEDVQSHCKGVLPNGWPEHGLAVLNNMHAKFPDYPVSGIIFMMGRNDFIGGRVHAAIRATGATENETVRPGAIKIAGAFPATYVNTSTINENSGIMNIYEEGMPGWSFRNMRDNKVGAIATLASNTRFTVKQVNRGTEYGFCFGRIDFREGQRDKKYWVVLGLETHSDLRPDQNVIAGLGHLEKKQLHFTAARRVG